MRKNILLLAIVILGFSNVNAKEFISLDAARMQEIKQSINDNNESREVRYAYRQLINSAKRYLKIENPSVMNKTIMPPTGDKHDYLSISRYWWPDSTKVDGLPWIQKDGITNPDTQTTAVDKKGWDLMCRSVRTLSLAYYFSDDKAYAEKAASILKTYFLDEDTKMNPNFNFAQSVPGKDQQRPYGILDARSLPEKVLDGIVLISNSEYWSNADNDKMNAWLNEYLNWLMTSETGIKGLKLKNNHGSWYKFSVGAVALYLDKKDVTAKMVNLAKESIEKHYDANGGQPQELKRTKPFFYSCFNLEALVRVASLGQKVGVDLWAFESKDNKKLAMGIDYLAPYFINRNWELSTTDVDYTLIIPTLTRVPSEYQKEEYKLMLNQVVNEVLEEKLNKKSKFKDIIEIFIQVGDYNKKA
jgi:hypothetical protein